MTSRLDQAAADIDRFADTFITHPMDGWTHQDHILAAHIAEKCAEIVRRYGAEGSDR